MWAVEIDAAHGPSQARRRIPTVFEPCKAWSIAGLDGMDRRPKREGMRDRAQRASGMSRSIRATADGVWNEGANIGQTDVR